VTQEGELVWQYVNPVAGSGSVQQGEPAGFWVFRTHRYAPDYPGLDGKDLTPGSPIENFNEPYPVPDGSRATQPMTCQRVSAGGDQIRILWDPSCRGSSNYNLIVGNLAEVADYTLQSSECAIGNLGAYNWTGVPAGDLYFLLVGVDECSVYESTWGMNSFGEERNGTVPSNLCGVTTKIPGGTCR
jgi:hypothetical protein